MVECAADAPTGSGVPGPAAGMKRPREPDMAHMSACCELQRRLESLAESVDRMSLELLRIRSRALPPLPPLSALPEEKRAELETAKRARLAELVTVQCKKVLGGITAHKWCWPFLAPVDQNVYTDYSEKVAKPMDFGTIRSNLESGAYAHPDALAADVRLVFANARTYNVPGSDVHVMAETLLERFDERYVAYVVPRIADAEAASRREEETARRAMVHDPVREAEAAAAERALLARLGPLRAELADAKSLAAAACAPMTPAEKESLCEALGALPQPAFEAAIALVLHRCPSIEGAQGGMGLDLDALDALTLRQLASFIDATRSKGPCIWPRVPLGGGKLPREKETAENSSVNVRTSGTSQTPSPILPEEIKGEGCLHPVNERPLVSKSPSEIVTPLPGPEESVAVAKDADS